MAYGLALQAINAINYNCNWLSASTTSYELRGGAREKREGSDVHFPQPQRTPHPKKYPLTFFFFYCVFGRFSARGVQKHQKQKSFPKKLTPTNKIRGFFSFFF
jgi:hypothetical protein